MWKVEVLHELEWGEDERGLLIEADLTWLWCSMPILMVLMRIAIIMPLLKYLLSTMPQSFLLIPFQRSLQCPKHVLFRFLSPSPLSSKWFSSLLVSLTASSSFSSPLAESPTALTPSFNDNAHIGQSSGFWGTDRLMELASGWESWSCLFWWGQWNATETEWQGEKKMWMHVKYRTFLCFFNQVYKRSSGDLLSKKCTIQLGRHHVLKNLKFSSCSYVIVHLIWNRTAKCYINKNILIVIFWNPPTHISDASNDAVLRSHCLHPACYPCLHQPAGACPSACNRELPISS